MKNIVLLSILSILLLSGCSVNLSGEKRGFIYKAYGVEFTCSHEPSKTDVKIDKSAISFIDKVMQLLADDRLLEKLKNVSEVTTLLKTLGDIVAPRGQSDPKTLVTYCKQLIDGASIE